jgi:mono/diheme cytochrome c family protein
MKRVLAVLCLVPGLLFAAGAGDAAKGKGVFAAKCKGCHGAAGEGNPGIAKAMKVEMRALGSKEVQAKKDDELKKVVTDGTGKMKAVAGVAGTDLDNVIAFVRTLKQ